MLDAARPTCEFYYNIFVKRERFWRSLQKKKKKYQKKIKVSEFEENAKLESFFFLGDPRRRLGENFLSKLIKILRVLNPP